MSVIIDTGAIIALLDKREQFHHWSKTKAAELSYPFFTCEAVLSEAFHLLEAIPGGMSTLFKLLEKKLVKIKFNHDDNLSYIYGIMNKYSDLPASYADACLVRMSETIPRAKIFTLDSDFKIYRTSEGKKISLIFPGYQ